MAKAEEAKSTKGPAAAGGELKETVKGGALATIDFEADAGAGLEGADKDSFAVPFLVMLQGLSPAVAEQLIEGAKAGLMLNTITNELFSKVSVVPVATKHVFLRWKPRDEGGGFKGEYSPADVEGLRKDGLAKEVIDEKGGRHLMYDGDELKDTRVHYVLQLTENGPKPIILSLASTQIKTSKKWMTRIRDIRLTNAKGEKFMPPAYSHVYELKSVKESNNKGTWFSFDINILTMLDTANPKDAAIYRDAQEFHKQFMTGMIKANFEQTGNTPDDGSQPSGDKF